MYFFNKWVYEIDFFVFFYLFKINQYDFTLKRFYLILQIN